MAATGFAAVSLQPNAGSQGEYAGLLVIRAYHESRGEGASRRLPDSRFGARHQPGIGADGRHVRWSLSPATRRATSIRRPRGEGRRARGQPCGAHDHVPLDARRVRGERARDLRDRACARRPGVHGRREHERAGRPCRAGRFGGDVSPPESAQDVLHSARRRRPGRGPCRSRRRISRSSCPIDILGLSPRAKRHRRGIARRLGAAASILPISWMYIAMMGAKA